MKNRNRERERERESEREINLIEQEREREGAREGVLLVGLYTKHYLSFPTEIIVWYSVIYGANQGPVVQN